jgi:hypothetical protein
LESKLHIFLKKQNYNIDPQDSSKKASRFFTGSSDCLYDKLDFNRPNVEHLCPHYQSTKTLVQSGSQEALPYRMPSPLPALPNESYV